jgi:hypothetical protein
MTKKTVSCAFDIDIPFVTKWMLDGVANTAHKGVLTSSEQSSDFLKKIAVIREGDDPDGEIAQTETNKLLDLVMERDAQVVDFEKYRDHAAAEWSQLSGKAWLPFVPRDKKAVAKQRSKTATNALVKKLLAERNAA